MAALATHFAALLRAVKTDNHVALALEANQVMAAYRAREPQDYDDKGIMTIIDHADAVDPLTFLTYPVQESDDDWTPPPVLRTSA